MKKFYEESAHLAEQEAAKAFGEKKYKDAGEAYDLAASYFIKAHLPLKSWRASRKAWASYNKEIRRLKDSPNDHIIPVYEKAALKSKAFADDLRDKSKLVDILAGINSAASSLAARAGTSLMLFLSGSVFLTPRITGDAISENPLNAKDAFGIIFLVFAFILSYSYFKKKYR